MKSIYLFSFIILPISLFCQIPGSRDTTFKSFTGFGGIPQRSAVVDEDGNKIVVGGFVQYDDVNIYGICKLDSNNNLDTTMFRGFLASETPYVTKISKTDANEYLIGGDFDSYNNFEVNGIMKLDSLGEIDTMFNDLGSGFDAFSTLYIRQIQEQPDGKIYVCGNFHSYNGVFTDPIIRLNADGSRDLTFNVDISSSSDIYDFVVLPDGSLIIGGSFSHTTGGFTKNGIMKVSNTGALDLAFHLAGKGLQETYNKIYDIEITPDGKLLIGGSFAYVNLTSRYGLCKLNLDASIDFSFNNLLVIGSSINAMEILDDRIYISGYHNYGSGYTMLSALNLDGSQSLSFITYPHYFYTDISDFIFLPDGDIFLFGGLDVFGDHNVSGYIQLNADGSIDESVFRFNGPTQSIYDLEMNPDSTFYIGGSLNYYDKYKVNYIAKILNNGDLDTSFNTGLGFNSVVDIICRQPNDRIIVAGAFTTYNGIAKNHLTRLMPDGNNDPLFNIGTGPLPYGATTFSDIELLSDNKIIIAGSFTTFSGVAKQNIVRLFTNGTVDLGFTAPVINSIKAIAIQPDNKIIVGGSFTTVGLVSKKGLARLNPDGSLDATFNTGVGGSNIVDIAIQPDGKIIVVGYFLTYDGFDRPYIARLLPNGSIDTTFGTDLVVNDDIEQITLTDDGYIVIVGNFDAINGFSAKRLAVLSPEGEFDVAFNNGMGLGFEGAITGANIASDNKIMAYGGLLFNGKYFNGICRLFGPECSPSYDTIYANIFEGEVYILPDGTEVTTEGTYTNTFDLFYDCDSTVITILDVLPLECSTPVGIFTSNITASSVKIHWSAVAGAVKYNIWYREAGVAVWTKKNSTTTIKKLVGLNPETIYEYKVRTSCDGATSDFSPINTFTTLPMRYGVINKEISLFPNPSSGNFTLSLPASTESLEIEVRNINGILVYKSSFEPQNGILHIELKDITGGVYCISGKSSDFYFTKQIIII